VVGPATGDADDVFAGRVNPVAGCHPAHPQEPAVVWCPPRPGQIHVDTWAGQAQGCTSAGARAVHRVAAYDHNTHYCARRGPRGAVEKGRITLPGGRLIHLELWFGRSVVMVADEFPEHDALSPATAGCTSAVLCLQTSDVGAVWARALDAGASVARPLAETFWGEREGQVAGPFGYRRGLFQHVRDVSLEEMSRAAAGVLSGSSTGPRAG
jgi:PhnB protein